MKITKFVSIFLVAAALSTVADAASIGRAGGGGGRSASVSVSRPSTPSVAPSKPSVAPAPSHPGGIGGTTASVGVRKSEVTSPVRNEVALSKPSTPSTASVGSVGSTSSGSYAPHYTPTPSYGYAPAPAPSVTNGSTFMSSLGGSMLGTMLGNSLSRPANTTVVTGGGGQVISSANAQTPGEVQISSNPTTTTTVVKKEYTVWSFIADLFGFIIVVALLLGAAWLFYKGFQFVRDYVNKERGVKNQPFNPTQQFWRIQRAFAEADVTELKVLLGPDVVDELTNDLQPQTLTLKNVSHEVRLENSLEFSIWYKFEDNGEQINQVWHYERFGSQWKLNGIENV